MAESRLVPQTQCNTGPNAATPTTAQIDCHFESKEPADPEAKEPKTTDLVFPSFDSVAYLRLTDKFTIAVPPFISTWLVKLLSTINASDIAHEVHAFAWMVLLYPSLLLLQHQQCTDDTDNLNELVACTLAKMRSFMVCEAESNEALELNDALICAELFADCGDAIPSRIWRRINALMEPTTSFCKFLRIACSRVKEQKAVKELRHCSSSKIDAKVRSRWESFVGVYTQICRLHRLSTMHSESKTEELSSLSRANIAAMTRACEGQYGAVLCSLFEPLKQRSDSAKVNYCYYRYKTMCMSTHTPTAIPPTFAGCVGVLSLDNGDDHDHDVHAIDARLWRVMVEALSDDVHKFADTVARVLRTKNENEEEWRGVGALPNKERRMLRILDSVSYLSTCALIMFESLRRNNAVSQQDSEHYEKLMVMRKQICVLIGDLAKNGLLFVEVMHGLDGDVLDSCFLTDDCKEGKESWSLHLMGGLLLNFWRENNVW